MRVPVHHTKSGLASWLGYSDEKMKGLLEQSKIDGFHHYKLKVGGDLERDLRRLKLFRDVNGWDDILMLDSNQVRLRPPHSPYQSKLSPLFTKSPHHHRSGPSLKQSLTLPTSPLSNRSSLKNQPLPTTSSATPLSALPSVSTISKSPPASIVRIVSCSSSSYKLRR